MVDVVSGQSLTGSLSWMLLANQTLKNYLQLLANEKRYLTRLWAYHQRFFRLYLLVLVAVYGVYLLHLSTPLSLILRPFGLNGWSAGLTRASVRLLHLDWQGAWDYNPLIYPSSGLYPNLFLSLFHLW